MDFSWKYETNRQTDISFLRMNMNVSFHFLLNIPIDLTKLLPTSLTQSHLQNTSSSLPNDSRLLQRYKGRHCTKIELFTTHVNTNVKSWFRCERKNIEQSKWGSPISLFFRPFQQMCAHKLHTQVQAFDPLFLLLKKVSGQENKGTEWDERERERTTKGWRTLLSSSSLSLSLILPSSLFDMICCNVRVSTHDRRLPFQGR